MKHFREKIKTICTQSEVFRLKMKFDFFWKRQNEINENLFDKI